MPLWLGENAPQARACLPRARERLPWTGKTTPRPGARRAREEASPAGGGDHAGPGARRPQTGRPRRDRGRDACGRGSVSRGRGRPRRDRGRDARGRGRPRRDRGRDARGRGSVSHGRGRPRRDRGRDARSRGRRCRGPGRSFRSRGRCFRGRGTAAAGKGSVAPAAASADAWACTSTPVSRFSGSSAFHPRRGARVVHRRQRPRAPSGCAPAGRSRARTSAPRRASSASVGTSSPEGFGEDGLGTLSARRWRRRRGARWCRRWRRGRRRGGRSRAVRARGGARVWAVLCGIPRR